MANITNIKIPNTFMGPGAISNIGDMAKEFAPTRVLIVTDAGVAKAGVIDMVKAPLEEAGCKFDIFDSCETEPTIRFLEKLSQKVKAGKYDLLIGVGGGSVMDSTKVASMVAANGVSVYDMLGGKFPEKTIPKILVPTTAGTGSEWSVSAVVYDDKANNLTRVIHTLRIGADAVIVDPVLTANLPPRITADTGMDALIHAIEAYVGVKASIVSDMLACTAIKLVAENLRPACAKGSKNIEARNNMSIAASLAMLAGWVSNLGLVHTTGPALGRKAHISHGASCTFTLPHVMEFHLLANPEKFAKIAELMGENTSGLSTLDAADKSIEAVRRLARDVGMPQKLSDASDVAISEADIPEMVEEVFREWGPLMKEINPRDVSPEDVTRIFVAVLGESS